MKEIIEKRKSVRSFIDQPLNEKDYEYVNNYINLPENLQGPFKTEIKIHLVGDLTSDFKLGTYGLIKGATTFLIIIAKNEKNALLDSGYLIEKLTLDFLQRDIVTCVMAGTYKTKDINKAIELQNDELIIAVLPLGYESSKKGLKEKVQRKVIRSANRKKPEELFFDAFSNCLVDVPEELQQVRLAPSSLNAQPWRVKMVDNKANFFLNRNKLNSKKMKYDVQYVDLGIALYNYTFERQYNLTIESQSLRDFEYLYTVELL